MNEALKKDKVRLKGQESDASASDAQLLTFQIAAKEVEWYASFFFFLYLCQLF